MTEQKSLKSLVRERMTRTGESYTTARRHVTAHAPVPAGSRNLEPGAVANYSAFGFLEHRPAAQARHMLGAAGINISEPMACGLGGGVGFMYSIFEYKEVDHPLLTIVAQHHPMPWLSAVAENLGLELETLHSSSAAAARKKLDASIDAGTPASLTVARGLLPHHAGVSAIEVAEPYEVVVAGRRGDDYLVDDLSATPHVLDGAALATAWAGHRKGRFEMTTLVAASSDTLADNLEEALPMGVRRAVRMTVDHLSGPVLGHSYDVNFGFSGMRKLTTELQDRSTKQGWARRFATPAQVSYACDRLSECLTSAYTAPGATRPLYAMFLAEASALVQAPALAEAAALFARSGEDWKALATEARLQAQANEDRAIHGPEVFSGFADAVEACVRLEEQAAHLMREYLAGTSGPSGG